MSNNNHVNNKKFTESSIEIKKTKGKFLLKFIDLIINF